MKCPEQIVILGTDVQVGRDIFEQTAQDHPNAHIVSARTVLEIDLEAFNKKLKLFICGLDAAQCIACMVIKSISIGFSPVLDLRNIRLDSDDRSGPGSSEDLVARYVAIKDSILDAEPKFDLELVTFC